MTRFIKKLLLRRHIEPNTEEETIATVIDRVNARFEPGDPERYEVIDKELKKKFDILAEVEL